MVYIIDIKHYICFHEMLTLINLNTFRYKSGKNNPTFHSRKLHFVQSYAHKQTQLEASMSHSSHICRSNAYRRLRDLLNLWLIILKKVSDSKSTS